MEEWSLRLTARKVRTPEGVPALVVSDTERPPGPLVLVVHGLRSRKERHWELCLELARAGFTAAALDAVGHGERATTEEAAALGQPDTSPALAALFGRAIVETVADLGVVARYLGYVSYGVIGHSMGGYVALKTACTDPAVAAAVSISGNPDWAGQAEAAGLPTDVVAAVRGQSPLTLADRFYPRPLLMLHGDADQVVPISGAQSLYHYLRDGPYSATPEAVSLVTYPGVGHDFLPDMVHRSVDWMQRFLKP